MSAALLVAGLLAGLLAAVAGAVLPSRARNAGSSTLAIGACAAALLAAVAVLHGGRPAVVRTSMLLPLGGLSLSLDPFGALFVAIGAVVGICALVFRLGYGGHGLSGRTASSALALFVTSLLLVPASASVTTFLFAWELMALSSLVLVLANHRQRAEAASAGQWYAVMTQAGAAALLVALVLLGERTGSQSFAAIAAGASRLPAWVRSSAFLLALAGFGSKAGMVPLHVWLPRAHPEAPGPVSALMSTAMVSLGVYGVVRVGDGLLGGGPAWWWLLVMGLGALSALFGALHASTSTDLKRLLAHSTTDNVGLVLLGVGASGLLASAGERSLALVALAAALLHVLFHAAFKGAMFLGASSIQEATGTTDLDRLGGLLGAMPATGAVMIVGGLSLAALPPLCGFVSEWLLLQAMLHGLASSSPALSLAMPLGVGVLALTGGLSALAVVKAIGVGLLGQARTDQAARAGEVGPAMSLGAGALAGACVAFGVSPGLALPAVLAAVRAVTRPGSAHPLTGGLRLALSGVPGGIAPGLLALVLAGSIALAAVARRMLSPDPARRDAAWGCGRAQATARMEYTATSFGEPLTRVFEDVLRPSHDLDVSHVAESRYYVEAASFQTSLEDAFERHLYRPLARGLRRFGVLARRVPNGSVHRYLAFGLAALLVVLVVVR